ncbi:MAG: FtsX-like permease family protein, partial [Nitrososphaerota archaeon]
FAAIGLVALLAGSFGVVNTMIMSISERTREIGTLKAIGARDSKILKIFLTEALLIGLIGGAIGVIVGTSLSYVFPMLTRGIFGAAPFIGGRRGVGLTIAPAITPFNIALCFSLGVLVGILAGLYPAWRAARMKPVEALRHV